MSTGDGQTPGGDDSRPEPEVRRYLTSNNLTPEQGCLGCGLGLLAVLLAALFWAWFFWRMGERERQPGSARPVYVAVLRQDANVRNER